MLDGGDLGPPMGSSLPLIAPLRERGTLVVINSQLAAVAKARQSGWPP